MDHLIHPIDLELFPDLFKQAHRELRGEGTKFIGFKQTRLRWTATFQTLAETIEYSGNVRLLQHWMQNKTEYLKRMAEAQKPKE